ncbi:MAG: hypothetical protein AAF480_02915 [Actinomycetota bacterium]
MTDVAADAAATAGDDERLAYRSVFQRLFIRPEIGAMIGAVGIWTFFWAVSLNFGTAGGTQNWLDQASTLGIMAVAVSMLMIGGEFDLSSGANTGAMGILFILLVRETGDLGGLGASIWIAVPLSLAIALAIGAFNGWMVERTALPSFIVTLGTFFVLKGAKLGLAKLIVGQISVSFTQDAHGYDFWSKIFASEWARNDHVWDSRDVFYTTLLIAGAAVIALAVSELFFTRRSTPNQTGLGAFVAGLAGSGVGIGLLHGTDGTGGNWVAAIVIAVSVLVAWIGWAMWRYEPLEGEVGSFAPTTRILEFMGLGVVSLVAATICAFAIDSDNSDDLFFPFTTQGLRAVLVMVLAGAGFTLMMMAANQALRVNAMTKSIVSLITSAAIVVFAFVVQASSDAEKFRTEAFSALLLVALALAAWSVLGLRHGERRGRDAEADGLGGRGVVIGAAMIAVGVILRHLFITNDELLAGVSPAKFSIRMVWFFAMTAVMVWVLARTRFGSWTFAVGGNKEASRQVGVPAARTKTQLFMIVSVAAWLVGMLLAFRLNSLQASTGDGEEFEFIIAAVVGGTLLTGGYGTAFGGAIGACIMAMSAVGIGAARWNSDWRFVFLGVILLLAVIANRWIRTKAEGSRR